MVAKIYIDTSIVGGFFDKEFALETINEQKEFDCLKMKQEIQAKIYAEIKDMTTEERLLYFHIPPEQDAFRRYNKYDKSGKKVMNEK